MKIYKRIFTEADDEKEEDSKEKTCNQVAKTAPLSISEKDSENKK